MHSDKNYFWLLISLTERKKTLEMIERDKECIGIEHISGFGVHFMNNSSGNSYKKGTFLFLSHIYHSIVVLVLLTSAYKTIWQYVYFESTIGAQVS